MAMLELPGIPARPAGCWKMAENVKF